MEDYSIIRVYASEKSRYEGKDLSLAVLSYVKSLRIAARCVVLRGVGGCYESGETTTTRIVELSSDLPLVIEIVLPRADERRVLERLDAMVLDGLVAVIPAAVSSHRTAASLVPRNLRVRDVMTRNPVCAHADFPARSAAELLFDASFKALPVVDLDKRCVGILTQGDLMARAGMPARLGLMSLLPERERERWLASCEGLRCEKVMTPSPTTVREDSRLADAIKLMNKRGLKRLPVLDDRGAVTGMLSRIDILRAIAMTEEPEAPAEAPTEVSRAGRVGELGDRDAFSLRDSLGLKAAIDALVANGRQRAAVVDGEGRLVGIVTDRILMRELGGQIGGRLAFGPGRRARRAARPISGIMERGLKVATEGMSVYEALRLMAEYGLKRLPIVDEKGAFRGMIGRDSILLAVAEPWDSPDAGAAPPRPRD
jgi:CBS-domain-containing membrane protein